MLRSCAVGALLLVVVAGCGDARPDVSGAAAGASATPTSHCTVALPYAAGVRLDLDSDGTVEFVGSNEAQGDCPASLISSLGGTVPVKGDLPITELLAIRIPGRHGDVVLATQSSPRGGSQSSLFGYADGKFAELTVDGKPLFGFVATDAATEHVSAACTPDGFTVSTAVAHQPPGVVPAWDVSRTAYTVSGNTVTKGATTQVADNVLDSALGSKYPALVSGAMFTNCPAGLD